MAKRNALPMAKGPWGGTQLTTCPNKVGEAHGHTQLDAPCKGLTHMDAPLEGLTQLDAPYKGLTHLDAPYEGLIHLDALIPPGMMVLHTLMPH